MSRDILSFSVLFSQLVQVMAGQPHQIYTVLVNRSVAGVSIVQLVMALVCGILCFCYGFRSRQKVLWIPQIPSILFTTITIVTFIVFKK